MLVEKDNKTITAHYSDLYVGIWIFRRMCKDDNFAVALKRNTRNLKTALQQMNIVVVHWRFLKLFLACFWKYH